MSSAQEIIDLKEELARCKADKEFVWSLWKQLQQESPDITQAISDAVNREKNKQEISQEKLTATLKERDVEIDALKEEFDSQSKAIAKLEIARDKLKATHSQTETRHISENQRMLGQLNKATEEVGSLRSLVLEKEAEVDQHLKAIEVIMRRAGGLEKELKSSKMEAMRLYTLNTNLQETIGQLQNNERLLSADHNKEIERLQKETGHLSRAMRKETISKQQQSEDYTLTDSEEQDNEEVMLLQLKISKLSKVNDVLVTTNMEMSEIIEEKEREVEEGKRLMQLMETTNGGSASAHELADIKKMLSRTKKELLETKQQLTAKEEEIDCVKEKHDRRLVRMKNLRDSHELVLEQIKTYDSGTSPVTSNENQLRSRKSSSHHRRSGHSLRHENSSLVWNELSKYKTLYQEIQQDKVKLDEELDAVKVNCASYQSIIAELRTCLQKEKNASETKLRKQEETVFVVERFAEEQIEKLEMLNEELTTEKEKLSDDNRQLNDELYELRMELADLQKTLTKLQHKMEYSTSRLVTASTMTDCITTVDSTTQIDKSSSEETVKMSSSVSSLLSTDKFDRMRHYSDGQLAFDNSSLSRMERTASSVRRQPSLCSACGNKKESSIIKRQRSKSTQPSSSCSKTRQSSSSRIKKDRSATSIKAHVLKQVIPFEHHQKCVWQEKIKKYQQQLKLMSKQVTRLTITNASVTQSLEESEGRNKQQDSHIKAISDKNNTLKSTIQTLRNEIKSLESSCCELKGKCDGLEAMGVKAINDRHTKDLHVQEENRKLKEEKKVLNSKLSSLSNEVKSLENELKQSTTVNETLQLKINNLERDLKQKRLLINEYKKRMASLDDQRMSDKEQINSLMSQVESLQNALEHFKQRVNCLKSQTEQFVKEKKTLRSELTKCHKQLDSMNEELNNVQDECKKKSQQLMLVKQTTDKKDEESHKQYQLALIEVEKETEVAQLLVLEYRDFLMDLAREISYLQQKSIMETVEKTAKKRKTDIFKKARTIAQTTFDLSDIEVDDFMMGRADRTMPAYATTGMDATLASRVGVLLNSHDSHLPKKQLISEFSSYVQYLLG